MKKAENIGEIEINGRDLSIDKSSNTKKGVITFLIARLIGWMVVCWVLIGGEIWLIEGAYESKINIMDILIFFLLSLASHEISFRNNFLKKKEYETITIAHLFMVPYKRMTPMYAAIIWWAISTNFFVSSVGALVTLIILKTVIDIITHLKEHNYKLVMIAKEWNKAITDWTNGEFKLW